MAATGHLSVQAIKGKFEQLHDVSNETNLNSGEYIQFRRHKSHLPTHDSQKESFLQNESSDVELSDGGLSSSRLRSFSVGNPSYFSHDSNDEDDKSSKKVNRNQSFKQQRINENGTTGNLNSVNYAKNNFSSFSEKQRLVESIVMNIKNNAKRKEEEGKNKDIKVKDVLSITSKLEKDLKNVLERGARLKWNSKSTNKSNIDVEKSCNSKQEIVNQRYELLRSTPLAKIDNNIPNVDLYPIRACISEDIDILDTNHSYKPFRSESSPDLSKKFSRSTAMKPSKHKVNSPDEVDSKSNSFKNEKNFSVLHTPNSDIETYLRNSNIRPGETSPIRPPRRRVKKNKAPLPPSFQSSCNDRNSLHGNDNEEPMFNNPNVNYKEKFAIKSNFDLNTRKIEKSLNLPGNVNGEFTYEDFCERTLEGEQFLDDKANIEHTYINNSPSLSPVDDDESPILKFQYVSENPHSANSSLAEGSPPKKPPRTFAHDIYRTLKSDKCESTSSHSTTKLSALEIESLYTKPLKRLKDKPISSPLPPIPKCNDTLSKKPVIAPKPTDILSRAKKRFSVVEPLPSRDNKELLEKKPSIRRNSSFRFSFKRNKGVSSPSRQTTPRKETKLGKKIKIATRNWSPRRHDSDKRVRFQSDTKSDNNSDDGGPIYATPTTNKQKVKEQPKELHYMCSPLFKEDERNLESHKENRPPTTRGGFERFGLMDGLRQELRQSCRLVQKRLKSTTNDRRNYKGRTLVD